MDEARFDVAPVAGDRVFQYVTCADLANVTGDVGDRAQTIDASRLLARTTPIEEVVTALYRQEWYFVLGPRRVESIVTRAYLQRPAITLYGLSLVLRFESEVDRHLAQLGEQEWLDRLSDRQRSKVLAKFEEQRDARSEMTLVSCLNLGYRVDLMGKIQPIWEDFGFKSRTNAEKFAKSLEKARDRLAHGSRALCKVS